eukprot:Pompholyxophrys_punicea_v1_NODE_436_length_1973_cov_4.238269.p2 type:complete len:113 gc:universal NODE_436_length_1973_cov_4.238269:548-886(+)
MPSFEKINFEKLIQMKAMWHTSCKLKFTDSKVQRIRNGLQKREESDPSMEGVQKSKRRKDDQLETAKCFFLHKVETLDFGERIKKQATDLNDFSLHVELSKLRFNSDQYILS